MSQSGEMGAAGDGVYLSGATMLPSTRFVNLLLNGQSCSSPRLSDGDQNLLLITSALF